MILYDITRMIMCRFPVPETARVSSFQSHLLVLVLDSWQEFELSAWDVDFDFYSWTFVCLVHDDRRHDMLDEAWWLLGLRSWEPKGNQWLIVRNKALFLGGVPLGSHDKNGLAELFCLLPLSFFIQRWSLEQPGDRETKEDVGTATWSKRWEPFNFNAW